jgi:putative spermidine/putrescine transport system substrate-binding protein
MEALKPNVLSIFDTDVTVMQVAQGQADVAGLFYSKSVNPYTRQGAPIAMCYPKEGTFAGINTVTLVKNCPERELAPSLGGLSFKPEAEKYMAYPESKMDEMGIFSPDWSFINPMRSHLIEKYNEVFGA